MSDLETRYQRLLAWFPRDHRDVHEEEMLGVLMAGARPGQRRPDLREAANLVGGGLTLRVRRLVKAGAHGWQDAFAVAGVIGALLVLVSTLAAYIANGFDSFGPMPFVPLSAAIAVVVAAALDHRWSAAVAAWLVVLAPFASMVATSGLSPLRYVVPTFTTLMAALTAILLTIARKPKRGFTLLGRRSLVGVTAVGVALGGLYAPMAALSEAFEPFVEALPLLLALPLVAGLVGSPLGRRVVVLLFVPLVTLLAPNMARDLETQPSGVLLALFVIGLLAVLAGRYLRVREVPR